MVHFLDEVASIDDLDAMTALHTTLEQQDAAGTETEAVGELVPPPLNKF